MKKPIFVIQKHHAKSLHFDFRLQHGKVLKSWAIPKGPSMKVGEKRLAIETEDHALSYADFEGEIPVGHYGAGKVEIWDGGEFDNVKKGKEGTAIPFEKCMESGQIEIDLHGKKINGKYDLVRFKEKRWLLIKMH